MLRKFVCAAVIVVIGLGVVMADEFNAVITKVDGNKVTFRKGKKDSEETTLTVTADAKIVKGSKYNKDTKKYDVTDPLESGLKNEMFSKTKLEEKGVFATITTDADNKHITAITVGKKGKKKNAN
jgi:hypothetical protein